jgi:hypothetical protein
MTGISLDVRLFGFMIILNRGFGELFLRVELKGVEILLEKEGSVGCVFSIDFGKKVFFGVGIERELFHGLIFGDVPDTILKLWTVNDTLQIGPDGYVFLNTHLDNGKLWF